jgi:hypothetical protein
LNLILLAFGGFALGMPPPHKCKLLFQNTSSSLLDQCLAMPSADSFQKAKYWIVSF